MTARLNGEHPDDHGQTWIESDQSLARRIARPMREFLQVEMAGGVILLVATVAALVLANTPVGDDIRAFWAEQLTIAEIGSFRLSETLGHWVNDGLMTIFFFVVGLEIKREAVEGELRDPRQAAVPVIAAIGGMVVPAALFLLFNTGGAGSDGWGIPMATDIAFAVGIMTLLGPRVPTALKVFLLTLAIADDIGAVLVIAAFYNDGLSLRWLGLAVLLLATIIGLRRLRVWYLPVYVVLGTGVWMAMLESGVHATIAGVVLGVLAPARPLRPRATNVSVQPSTPWGGIRSAIFDAKESISVAERLQNVVHPWSSFVILPIFAFANAGIVLSRNGISDAATSPVTLGVAAGLVIGKPLGIMLATFLAVRTRIGRLPRGVSWPQMFGVSLLAGIGFTVAIFVTGLSFDDRIIGDEAKIGVLAASFVAAAAGAYVLSRANGRTNDLIATAPVASKRSTTRSDPPHQDHARDVANPRDATP